MDADPSIQPRDDKRDLSGVRSRWLRQAGFFTLVLVACLFMSSGRLDWVMAWVYVGVFVVSQAVTGLVLIPNNPELLADRTQMWPDKPRDLDRVLAGLMALFGPASIWIVAGLDKRFEWSAGISPIVQVTAVALAMWGTLLTIWAMASNRFFYGVLRIRKDRGHTVATNGPYQYVRHPGYLGAILFDLATPLFLGTSFALIPAAFTVAAIIVRTALEDRTLHSELDGYQDYAARVPYRLLPGVW